MWRSPYIPLKKGDFDLEGHPIFLRELGLKGIPLFKGGRGDLHRD
jgi:hypothetical protein